MMSYKMEYLVVHCSDSNWGTRKDINNWHLARGWKGIGYNAVICNGYKTSKSQYDKKLDGLFEEGRSLDFNDYVDSDEKAAHVLNYNHKAIGICLIGRKLFTLKQYTVLYNFCKVFKAINPKIKIVGHYEMSTANGKTCPNFDVSKFRELIEEDMYIATLQGTMGIKLPVQLHGETV